MHEHLKKKFEEIPLCFIEASKNYEPNGDIIFYENILLSISTDSNNSKPIKIKGNIVLKLSPKPRLIIEIESKAKILLQSYFHEKIIVISANKFKLYSRVTNLNLKGSGEWSITLSTVDDKTHQVGISELTYASFNLLNFPMCFGKAVRGRVNPRVSWRSRLNIRDDEWKLTFDKIENYKYVQNKLNLSDGYGITYAGQIKKINGKKFDSNELSRIINKTYYFLSFARGANTPIFDIQGFNDNGENIWHDLSLHRSARWSMTQHNWFSEQHSFEQLSELFAGWSKLFDDMLWQKELPKILYWYLYAGRNTEGAGTDGSLVIAIAALELFSFNFLVRYTFLRDKEKYGRKNLSNNIYKMLNELNIPIHLPKNLNNLYKYSIEKSWQTGPKAIVDIRNEIVHPDRDSSPSSRVCYESLQLALWYIEMVVLKLCQYKGVYSNRTDLIQWSGIVEQVPWHTDLKG